MGRRAKAPAEKTAREKAKKVIPIRKRDGVDPNMEKLVRAGQKLFAAQGLAGTQVAQITREAGTGISMFYRHFKDKNELLNHILDAFFVDLQAGLDEALESVERQSPLEQLFTIRKVFDHVIGMLVARPDFTLMIYRAGFTGDEGTETLVRERISRIALDIAGHVGRAEEAGIVVVKQKEVLGHAAVGLAIQVAHKLIAEGKPSLEEAVDTCTRFTLGGLLVFCPPETFDQIFPALRFMLQPATSVTPKPNPEE